MDTVELERDVPFARSRLWALMRAYYETAGPTAFTGGAVPSYGTTNAFVADQYARLAAAFLDDHAADELTVVEVGSGSGRLGFHLAQALRRIRPEATLRVVLTDIAESNVQHLRSHPRLAPLAAAGLVDFARFDLAQDVGLTLLESGRTLRAGSLAGPLVVVANYVLCAVPQEAYRVRAGAARRALVTLTAPSTAAAAGDAAILPHLRLAWREDPAPLTAEEQSLLAGYTASVRDGFVPIPAAAIAGLDRLAALTTSGTLFLASDRGDAHVEAFEGRVDPRPALHGTWSFRPNLHAIGLLAERRGGAFLRRELSSPLLETVAVALGPGRLAATRRAFAESVATFGPDDFYSAKRAFEASGGTADLDAILAFLRLSRFDPEVLAGCGDRISGLLAGADASRRAAIAEASAEAERRDFHVEGARDLPFARACVLYALGETAEALRRLEESLARHGRHPATLLNAALCHVRLGRPGPAARLLDEILAAHPGHERALELRARLPLARLND